MTKDNILFSIIGVLLGFIIGFFFANTVNQRAAAPSPSASANSSGLPADHPQVPTNAVKDQQALQAAVEEAAKRAGESPNDFDAQMRAATGYGQLGRYEEALDFLLRANEIRPSDYETVVQLGNANFELERYEAAERWYSAALVKKPDDVNVRTDLGLTFFFRKPKDADRAIEEFRRSLRYDPRHELTLQNIAAVLTDNKNFEEARVMLARLEKVNPNNRALDRLRDDIAKSGSGSESGAAAVDVNAGSR
ncbi:MAG TPA: tetratricopeptide repeat protein [Pyrinomonadaceae bacterium]|nr:tetratricopeptide repeat protein [Pyrinomonadaceae bacterium]